MYITHVKKYNVVIVFVVVEHFNSTPTSDWLLVISVLHTHPSSPESACELF